MTTQVAIRGKLGTANAGIAAVPVNVPTDTTAPLTGDWMVVAIVSTVTGTLTISPPSTGSWVQILASVAMGTRQLTVFRGVRGASDPAQYVFTQSTTGAAQSLIVYGAGVYGSVGVFSKPASTAATQTTSKVTTTVANSLALSIQGEATAATETDSQISVAAPFTKDLWTIASSSPINSVLLSHRDMSTAGDTGDAVSTWPNNTTNRGSVMVVIEPVPDPTPTPVTLIDARVADGAGGILNVKAKAWDGSADVGISRIEVVHGGTYVPDLDRTNRVWVMGHRGGSLDYQEHSARGYVQSAIAHVDVLEFSLGRTSDGVFFGLHDATLNRTTSGLAANYTASAHTWAEISALVQDLPNRGDTRFTSQPYLRLEDFIAQWSGSHTLMFDPKLINTAGRQALYPILQQIPRYQERVLGKFFHTGTTIADEFHAIGCKAWGYAYEEAITGLKPDGTATTDPLYSATMAKWDYLGMDFAASAAAWAQLVQMAGNKKIIGHIVANVDQANTAVQKGARALQVSGVNAVSAAY